MKQMLPDDSAKPCVTYSLRLMSGQSLQTRTKGKIDFNYKGVKACVVWYVLPCIELQPETTRVPKTVDDGKTWVDYELICRPPYTPQIHPLRTKSGSLVDEGCYNFMTGAGGYAQSFFYGYGGLRYLQHGMRLRPRVMPNTTR